jgi:hypothetical protein
LIPEIPELKLTVDIIIGDDEEAMIETRFLSHLCDKVSLDFKNSIFTLTDLKL